MPPFDFTSPLHLLYYGDAIAVYRGSSAIGYASLAGGLWSVTWYRDEDAMEIIGCLPEAQQA